jgi:hypothetical protein
MNNYATTVEFLAKMEAARLLQIEGLKAIIEALDFAIKNVEIIGLPPKTATQFEHDKAQQQKMLATYESQSYKLENFMK